MSLMLENKENRVSDLQKDQEADPLLNKKFHNPFLQSVKKIDLKPIADPTLETIGEKSLSIEAYRLSTASKELFDFLNRPSA
jgi:hypothetical protein